MGRPPPHVHGKEGVDGSSPSQRLETPANQHLLRTGSEDVKIVRYAWQGNGDRSGRRNDRWATHSLLWGSARESRPPHPKKRILSANTATSQSASSTSRFGIGSAGTRRWTLRSDGVGVTVSNLPLCSGPSVRC